MHVATIPQINLHLKSTNLALSDAQIEFNHTMLSKTIALGEES